MKSPRNLLSQKILTFFLLCLLFLSIFCQYLFFSSFDKAKMATARWPQFSKSHLKLALAFFQTGSEKCKKELEIAKKSLFLNKGSIQKTEEIINQPEEIKNQLCFWQSVIEKGIESPEIYLRLALLHFKIYEKEEAKNDWQKAFYFDPNNEVVKEAGKIVNH